MSKALVLNSGGLDSAIVLKWATMYFDEVHSMAFDYGQRNRRELGAALNVAVTLGVPHREVKLGDLDRLGGSLFKVNEDMPLETERPKEGLATTVIPGRNLIFLSYAAAFAHSLGTHEIVAGLGCRITSVADQQPFFVEQMQKMLDAGMPFGGPYATNKPWTIHTPLMHLTKAEAIRLMRRMGAFEVLKWTHTCYEDKAEACQKCLACQPRMAGFAEAGEVDPAIAFNDSIPF